MLKGEFPGRLKKNNSGRRGNFFKYPILFGFQVVLPSTPKNQRALSVLETHSHHIKMELTTLPDDALLKVLRYLDMGELLQCRRVCRRLRDAALHPDLWRKRRLTMNWEQNDGEALVSAALRLAPCLGRLSLDADSLENLLEVHLLGPLLDSTSCAVSELDLELYSADAGFVASAIARQAALGRLNSVSLSLYMDILAVRMLLDQLLHTQGLTSLGLLVDPDSPDSPWWEPAGDCVPSSLQSLQYGWADGPLSTLLQWHADTLQVLHLQSQLPADTAALLVALPNLRELKCPILDDMPALLQCPALTTLHLVVSGADRDDLPRLRSAQHYLRQAVTACLEALTLDFDLEEEEEEEVDKVRADALNLVQCLAGPDGGAPSLLRSLRLTHSEEMGGWGPQPQQPALASVLHRLVNLVSLDLGGPPTAAFLEAMDGQVVPRLQRLRVFGPERDCPHEWAHGQEPRALLMRCPRLHVEVASDHDAKFCGYCEANSCHVLGEDKIHTLFSHPERDGQCKHEHRGTDIRIVV